MPKIFKQNKFALLTANILIIVIWVTVSTYLINLLQNEDYRFYIYNLASLLKFLPPLWITWYLWVKREGFKR